MTPRPRVLGVLASSLAIAATLFTAHAARAMPALYVGGAEAKVTNNTTQIVVMREKRRTVLAILPDYQGPKDPFAMLIPVPIEVTRENIKVLPRSMFERIDMLAAPRLVEYWEMDPCGAGTEAAALVDAGSGGNATKGFGGTQGGGKSEPHFTVGEYDVNVLTAKETAALDSWLRANKLTLPANAEAYLKPYIEAGMKLVAVKIDAKKLVFNKEGIAIASPLRIVYDTDRFTIPLRVGLGSSPGVQEVIISVLARHQRYEAANYPNAFVPTNIDVVEGAKAQPHNMYTAMFDATVARTPRAFVTEYAWDATSCDPCPTPGLNPDELLTFGGDVLPAAPGETESPTYGRGFVLSRLHARYRRDELTEDLVLRAADPVAGGTEKRDAKGVLDQGTKPAEVSAFQARYMVRHAWTGPATCAKPRRGVWGGTPQGYTPPARAAVGLAYAQRSGLKLATFFREDVPAIGFSIAPPDAGASSDTTSTPSTADAGTNATPKRGGCTGCTVGDTENPAALAIAIPIVALAVRRRRHRR